MSRFYCGDELMARHYNFNFICGSRLGGKSTWAQKYAIKRAIKSKIINGEAEHKFAILVRYDKDVDTLCKTYFNNTMKMFYPDFIIDYRARRFYLIVPGKNEIKPILIGYGFALANATKMKSTSYPDIDTIIMEEFMNMEGKYIKSQANPELEVEMFISLFSTIARGNGHQFRPWVRCFLISNNFYLDNPYFKYFDLIEPIVTNPTKRFYERKKEPKCIVEMLQNDINLGVGRDDLYKGSKFVDMQNELKIEKGINIKKSVLQLSLDNREFLTVSRYNESFIIQTNGRNPKPDCAVYSCSEIKKAGFIHTDEWRRSPMHMLLLQEYNNNSLYYDKLETYIQFKNILAAI